MRSLKKTQAELDSILAANLLFREIEEVEPVIDAPKEFDIHNLISVNNSCLETVVNAKRFSKKMLKMMEMEYFDLENCAPPMDENTIIEMGIPIKTMFDELSEYVCEALAKV